jgi:eukaryotic-like serine/threonine-protein kinase
VRPDLTGSTTLPWLDTIAEEAARPGVETEGFLDELTLAFASNLLERLLPPDVASAARALAAELERLTKTGGEPALPVRLFEGTSGAIVLAWAESVASRSDVVIAGLLDLALRAHQAPSRLIRAARARVLAGPLIDALRCLPLAGDTEWFAEDAAARARIELLVWEAGAAALSIPRLGAWLFSSEDLFERWAMRPSQGSLRARVCVARLLQICADGFPAEIDAARGIRTARITRDLASHPEPLVWVPAALALGRLSARSRDVRALLFRWLESDNLGERRRAITALAAMPGPESWWLESRLSELFKGDADPWAIAALGPAIPYLAVERRELWLDLSTRISSEESGPEMLWSVTQGLLSLARRGQIDRNTNTMLREARRRAIEERARSTAEAQLYEDIRRHTDFLDAIDPDPNDHELAFHRTVSAAVRVGADKVAARAHALMRTLMPTFETAMARLEKDVADPIEVAAALSTVESCSRSAALHLWVPILRAAGREKDPLEVHLENGLEIIRKRVADLLQGERADFARHRTALRVLGSIADAAPVRGEAAAYVSAALERPAWLASLDKREASRFQKPLGDLLWRVVDASRHPDRPASSQVLFARFAAWWAIAARRADLLEFLSRSEAAARGSSEIFGVVEAIREKLSSPDGSWASAVYELMGELHAEDTALASALTSFGAALAQVARAERVRGPTASTVALLSLADAASELGPLVQNPQLALGPEGSTPLDQTIRDLGKRSISMLERDRGAPIEEVAASWSESLGPLLGPMAAKAVARLLSSKRSGAQPTQDRRIGGYRLVRRLGGGTQGEVWLVENDKNGRHFVMKLLTPAYRSAADRDDLKVALQMEADILKQIYHPNVANFVDSGWDRDQPYLVMEYLVGCDLEQYLSSRPMSLEAMKPIVHDICAGIEALGRFGLAHCDLKPGNVFLRLTDPGATEILGAVVIDFGVARTNAVVVTETETATVSGTLGYIAPEQADGAVHPKTDVYALAATIYRALTGHTFFDHLETVGRRLVAHHNTMPFDDPVIRNRLGGRSALIALLSEAATLDPEQRISIEDFARRFSEL